MTAIAARSVRPTIALTAMSEACVTMASWQLLQMCKDNGPRQSVFYSVKGLSCFVCQGYDSGSLFGVGGELVEVVK